MSFIKTLLKPREAAPTPPMPDIGTRLESARLILRLGLPTDWRDWHKVRAASQAYLKPWEPKWAKDALSYNHYCTTLRRQWREWREGKGYCFMIFLKETEATDPDNKLEKLIGGIALNDIIGGISQKGTLGYWIDENYTGYGLMTEAAHLVQNFAFTTLNLHRLEAACLPHNKASARVLEKANFTQEGYARHYMKINGHWEDHLLWGQVNPRHEK